SWIITVPSVSRSDWPAPIGDRCSSGRQLRALGGGPASMSDGVSSPIVVTHAPSRTIGIRHARNGEDDIDSFGYRRAVRTREHEGSKRQNLARAEAAGPCQVKSGKR